MSKKTINWCADQKAEDVLRSVEVDYEVVRFPVSEIDWKETDNNPARITRKLNEGNVEDYALAMMEGDHFPRPIVCSTEKGYMVVAGVHRCKAAMEIGSNEEIEAYLAFPKLLHHIPLICYDSNRREGSRQEKEEALIGALYLVQNCDIGYRDAAKKLRVNPGTVKAKLSAVRVSTQAGESGFSKYLSESHWIALSRLKGNDKVLVACASYVYNRKLTSDQTRDTVSEVVKHRTEASQLACIEEFDKAALGSPAETVVGPVKPISLPTRTKFFRWFNCLSNLVGNKKLEELQIVRDSDEHKNLKKSWADFKRRMNNAIR